MGHEFDNDFVWNWDLLERGVFSVLIFLGGMVAAWLIPAFLRLLFRRLLRSEITYISPDHDYIYGYDAQRDHARRARYAKASYWRTSFFDLLYVIVALSAFMTGIIVALWMLHWDFWYLVAGLGLYTAIALFQIGAYLQNVFAFFCLKFDYQGHIREGDYVAVAGHQGILAYIGLQRSKLVIVPKTTNQQQTSNHTHTRQPISTATTIPNHSLPITTTTTHPPTVIIPQVVFIPTAHLMQTVVRIERAR